METIIYISSEGKDLKMLLVLEKYLRQLEPLDVCIKHAAHITAGSDYWKNRTQYIYDADIFLALLSADFMNSELCQKEITLALTRRAENGLIVVPIMLRPTLVEDRELRSLQMLPKNGQALSESRNRESQLHAIVVEIREAICNCKKSRSNQPIAARQSIEKCDASRRVRITFEGELTTSEDLDEIMRRLRRVCGGSCELVKIEMGSIILTIDVPVEVIGQLLEAWRSGRLSTEMGMVVNELTIINENPSLAHPAHNRTDAKSTSESILANKEAAQDYPKSKAEWEHFIAQGGRPKSASYRSFIHAYGPVFMAAATREKSRYYRSFHDLPTQDEILQEIWKIFISRMDIVLNKFKPEVCSLDSYLYVFARHLATGYIRKSIKEQAHLESLKPSAGTEDLSSFIEDRDLLSKVTEAFKANCMDRRSPAGIVGEWDLFELYFVEGMSKEELTQRFGLSSNTFDVRVYRIRQQLRRLVEDFDK